MMRVLLVDNGSLEPASTRQLRRIAAALAERLGWRVDPVSVAHSTKVPAEALDGRPAELLEAALTRATSEGVDELIVAPLFIGPSYAIVRYVPALVEEKTQTCAGLKAKVAAPLYISGERRLAEILADQVRGVMVAGERPRVAVVDHGSPSRAVTEVRDAVADQVRELLGERVSEVAACSMERREGAEFDFNEPRLETLLARDGWRDGPVVVALLFIGPGKHAGPDGDVAQIVARARGAAKTTGASAGAGTTAAVKFTRVIGEDSRLLDILADRVRSAKGE